jgi:hypothetical protein
MKNIPSKIFLVVGEESDIEDINDFKSLDPEYVLWSEDRINSNDIEYIREKDNLIPSLETKNKELEGKLKGAKNKLEQIISFPIPETVEGLKNWSIQTAIVLVETLKTL